jgi:hypothetical protein
LKSGDNSRLTFQACHYKRKNLLQHHWPRDAEFAVMMTFMTILDTYQQVTKHLVMQPIKGLSRLNAVLKFVDGYAGISLM